MQRNTYHVPMTPPPQTDRNERRRHGKLNKARRAYRDRRIQLHTEAWGLFIGMLAIIASILFFALPDFRLGNAAVGRQLGDVAYAWNTLYLVAGGMVVYGIVRPHRPTDAAGLVLMATATTINFAAIAFTYGWRGMSVAPSLVGITIAALARARLLTGRVR